MAMNWTAEVRLNCLHGLMCFEEKESFDLQDNQVPVCLCVGEKRSHAGIHWPIRMH